MHLSRHLKIVLTLTLLTLLSACETSSYYAQAIHGHLSLLNKRQAIDDLLEQNKQAPALDPSVVAKLEQIKALRTFAQHSLHLPVGNHYKHYVDIEREAVVWNVFAAEEFSITPMRWCFLIVGCVSYRGYYDKADATQYSEKLKQQSLDTFIGGASAYSTLGWFNDPVLSTFIQRSEAGLASLLFHELAHQVLYFKNDATFNESFATVVELEGLKRWLATSGESQQYQQKLNRLNYHRQFLEFVLNIRDELDSLYQSDITDQEKRQQKQDIIHAMESRYGAMSKQWEQPQLFSTWFKKPINNARLSTVATYHSLVAPLQQLLSVLDNDLEAFYLHCKSFDKLNPDERESTIRALIQQLKSPKASRITPTKQSDPIS